MRETPLTALAAWNLYRDFRSQPGVVHLLEPSDLEAYIETWAIQSGQGLDWTDCALAAWAKAHGYRLVTMDRGFMRFDGLDMLCLTDQNPRL